ncbi:hydroxyethylthiazole kinase [Geosporobacter subterraneus DSM 17957]|uniref:Hydroxyethylthiazole kinase n=1 Tax=Geosporobacter subterraneus DSM 17957 TaxID=1121919 RepID=A0A1M6LAV3_9FIRM|nr:hydroxyethylthiazole kinase [Geosporobacter subterraneus]SHJ68331.1 hydroxyethylthiazole kinase [Geosporobacter subterraneus DSM 17957]
MLFSYFHEIYEGIKRDKPLIHHITNYVTVNDCANIVLALGGSPVMADDHKEVEEMVSIASALVLNVGTLNQRTIESFILAGKKANALGVPVVLDPVGVGATNLRTQTLQRILKEVKLSVLRGNMSEIKNIYGQDGKTRGVDSVDDSLAGGKEIALELAKRLDCVVAITGATDIISDGEQVFYIENGHKMLSRVTGTGCMTTSLIGTCVGTKKNPFHGAIMGTAIMGIAGEMAYEALEQKEAVGTFRMKLMDAIGSFSMECFQERGKIHEA